MGRAAWDTSHLGKLFERYLIYPLSELFDEEKNTKGHLDVHKLFSRCLAEEDWLAQVFSRRITIYNSGSRVGLQNICGKGDLLSYLEDPKESFFMPVKETGPDIVFVINVHQSNSSEPIRIPVFVQSKNLPPERTFFDNQHHKSSEKRNRIIECLKTKYQPARNLGISSMGMLVIYPYKIKLPQYSYDEDTQELTIIVDGANARDFIHKDVIAVLDALKQPTSKNE
ncbi:hypothetical protein BC938DRAFT_476443 [Jimgerdemannia flammicorona]|uniref:Uncharacterized protein n=1 Tax=Jimgerdemannia flammicorona TaxID=994334 RepID=A0A433QQI4_9FUNG|nr:hypothetical protein BC938DRAFT_476443 [Jimgerdemannia flammicorona]